MITKKHTPLYRGFAPIQIILLVLGGVVIVGGAIVGIFALQDNPPQVVRDLATVMSEGVKIINRGNEDSSTGDEKKDNVKKVNTDLSGGEINFHHLATGKNFGDILKLFNPVIDETSKRLYVVGSKTTNVGIVDLDKDELVEVFDVGVPGGFLIFSNQKLYSFDFSVNKCYEIDVSKKKASEISVSTCGSLVPGKEKGKMVKWGNYSFKETGYQSFKDGTTGFPADWSQDLNGAYGIIEIYNSSNVNVGRIIHGPDALYFTINSTTGKLYTTNTGDGSISIFDLNILEKTNYCKDNSCLVKEIDIGNSADEVIADSLNNLYVRNRLGGSVIYKYNIDSKLFTTIGNENHTSGGIGMWPTDMELSKDEKRLYVLSHYGALVDIIDTTTNTVKSKITFTTSLKPRTDSISAMAVDKSRDKVFAVWPELGVIGVGDGLKGSVLGTIDLTKYGFDKSTAANTGPGQVNMAVDEKTGKLYAYFSGKLFVFNGSTFAKENEVAISLTGKGGESILKIDSDNGKLYLKNKIFDLSTLKETGTIQKGSKVAAFNSAKKTMYVGELVKATAFKNNLKVYEYVNAVYSKEWHADGLGEIANTFFDFSHNVFYVADFLSGIVRKYSLDAGSAVSSTTSAPSGTTGQTQSGGATATNCDFNKDGTIDTTEQGMCGATSGGSRGSTGGAGGTTTGKCGDGVCGTVEKENGVCPADCK